MEWPKIRQQIVDAKVESRVPEFVPVNVSNPTLPKKPDGLFEGEDIHPFEEDTDKIAWYKPSQSPNLIVYDVDKVARTADSIWAEAVDSVLGEAISDPLFKSRELFRYQVAEFVRFHERFHYMIERSSRLIAEEGAYRRYYKNVYEPRKSSRIGNLEEALAEAYASVMSGRALEVDQEAHNRVKVILGEPRTRLLRIVNHAVQKSFISSRRPPGYCSGPLFVLEMEWLLFEDGLQLVDSLFAFTNARNGTPDDGLYDGLRSLTWMFDELMSAEKSEYTDYSRPPKRPYSRKIFCAFLESLRAVESSWFVDLLLPPDEEIAPRGGQTRLVTPPHK